MGRHARRSLWLLRSNEEPAQGRLLAREGSARLYRRQDDTVVHTVGIVRQMCRAGAFVHWLRCGPCSPAWDTYPVKPALRHAWPVSCKFPICRFVDLTMLAAGSRQNASSDELGGPGTFQLNVDGLRVTQNQTGTVRSSAALGPKA